MKGTYKRRENGAASSNKKLSGSFGKGPNGFGNGNNSGSAASLFYESAETNKQFTDRFDYLLVNSIGSDVFVTVVSGIQYEGLLLACNLKSTAGLDIVLKYPRRVKGSSLPINEHAEMDDTDLGETFLIHGADIAELELKNIDLSLDDKWEHEKSEQNKKNVEEEQKSKERDAKKEFKTDVDISGGKSVRERELKAWVPDELPATSRTLNSQTLEESSSTWDQFSVNEKKFGIKSSYDEHFYTTKINKDDPHFEQKLKEAQKLAEEIEGQGSSGNIHLAEDRGIAIDDSGMDEEDLYSGVDRRGGELLASLKNNARPTEATKGNRYLPPTLRTQPHHTDPAIISSSGGKTADSKTVDESEIPAQIAKQPPAKKESETKVRVSEEHKETPTEVPHHGKEAHLHDFGKKSSREPSVSRFYKDYHQRESPKPRIPLPLTKEAQIEELKKFSQKFKVPYEVPNDMRSVVKKNEEEAADAAAKSPSPKDQKKELSRKSSQQSQTHSPPVARGTTHLRRRPHGSFFSSQRLQSAGNKGALFQENFNFFKQAKKAHDLEKEMEPFFVEKPYFTAPTWNGTVEESYKTFFPDERTAIQEAQVKFQERQYNNMSAMGGSMNQPQYMMSSGGAGGPQMGMPPGGMMTFPGAGAGVDPNNVAGGPPGAHSPNPMMDGFPGGGMYLPFQPQPMFYPSMTPMMPMMGEDATNSPSPQAMSPHMPPAYMNMPFGYPGASGMPPFQGMMGAAGNGGGMPGGSSGSGHKHYYGHNSHSNGNAHHGGNHPVHTTHHVNNHNSHHHKPRNHNK
ncbi:Pbp1p KNAG_0H02640 [Huiozyma naganishii CBS 8797]|uniref:LsmAD domain-containing protein n=1 Tax=Huiozyma naganishii (strain ATCC MYA-139 / BCRC 22969 / CBS 8797 / KCTC 17520 / NBRC 10181 / NCYC 3082 / Yp74L-3) TaxID=1071383 RepID=J7S8Q1_HUIN7|nr:hypothetical protein KNAG_0H02640 [Kazachstania naganishii CBS 8797]CCK71679.1 hypothetical protein KNAG_0H02640 [Kazachstania naganishii CBS 8797]